MEISDSVGFVVRLLFVHLSNTPLYIALIVGVVVAARQRTRSASSARLALIGFSLALGGMFVFTSINAVLPVWLFSSGIRASSLGLYLGATGFVSVLVQTVAWGCLIAAFSRAWQTGQEQRSPTYERDGESQPPNEFGV